MAPTDLASVEPMILHYALPHHSPHPTPAPTDLASVEPMILHYVAAPLTTPHPTPAPTDLASVEPMILHYALARASPSNLQLADHAPA